MTKNIEFRIELHKMLSVDEGLQKVFLSMCRDYRPLIFNTTFWTFDPQSRINSPFILWHHQIPAVEIIDECIQVGKNVGINKTRKQGASEICCKLFVANCLLFEYNNFIVGSRKEDLVDNMGDQTTLFAKVDNALDCLPTWWKNLIGFDKKQHRKKMVMEFPYTHSAIIGETTNESFSAGSRATAMLLDEFGRVDTPIAKAIDGSVKDVSNCIIYSSTHWLGPNHTFNKALKNPTITIVPLMWYENPRERAGLYKTEEPGKYELIDKEYYEDKEIIVRDNIRQLDPYEKNPQIVADGLRGIPSPYRSPWFDLRELERDRRDFICNVCASPYGSSDAPFDQEVLEEIKKTTICFPDFEGEILFSEIDEESDVCFAEGYGQRRLKWWGKLPFGRPNQRHNYIIAVDPSYGLGSANSAIEIIDVNLSEQVGSFVDSYTKPEDLADYTVALAYWIGGVDNPFIIWETNGGCGTAFTDRIVEHNYINLYTQRREDSKTRKMVQKWGWSSNTKAKENILSQLSVALSNGLSKINTPSLIIHEEELLDELADYVFKEGGTGIVQSSRADLSTGAAERHGDRGIAIGLCVLGLKEQLVGEAKDSVKVPYGCFEYYRRKDEEEQERDKRRKRRFMY